MQPNMKKEYRAELKLLRKNRRVVLRDAKAFLEPKLRGIREMMRVVERAERETRQSVRRFDKRIAILEGRLS